MENHKGYENVVPDAMHTIKDVCQHIVELISGKKDLGKIEASEKIQRTKNMEEAGKRKRETYKTVGRFVLTKEEMALVEERCMSIRFSANETGCKGSVIKNMHVLKNTHA